MRVYLVHDDDAKPGMLLNQIQKDQSIDAGDYGFQTRDFFVNMFLKGLVEEIGEVAGIFKRIDRGDYDWYSEQALDSMKSELGDVLWYLAGLASINGLSFDKIWEYNREKIAQRYADGTIKGGHRDA